MLSLGVKSTLEISVFTESKSVLEVSGVSPYEKQILTFLIER